MGYNLLFYVLYPMVGGLISYGIGRKNKKIRDNMAVFLTASQFLVLLFCFLFLNNDPGKFQMMHLELPGFCGLGLNFVLDGFRLLYLTLAAFMWMVSAVLSKEYFAHYRNRNRYYMFFLITLGAVSGVFLAADFFTAFLFFEIASFTSYVWVVQDEKKEAMHAGQTYLAIAILGGMVMLFGIFLIYANTSTLIFTELTELLAKEQDTKWLVVAGTCIFFGFGAKAGAVPLHVWLPKAHPVAPAPASALLSGMLTKIGIFGILAVSSYIFLGNQKWGTFVLCIGVITMLVGAILALFAVDLKKILACSSVSQIGFILIGVGMVGLLRDENGLAIRGTILYMVNHSLFKLVLFLAAGVVFMNIHALNLNEIRGFGRKKPFLKGVFLMGALGIGGIPLFSGYISKTLIHESIVEYLAELQEGHQVAVLLPEFGIQLIEWLFLLCGGITIAYMLKIFIAVFVEENSDLEKQKKFDGMTEYLNISGKAALGVSAALFPLLGCLPTLFMDFLADMGQGFLGLTTFEEEISYFSLVNLKGSMISIAIGVFLYMVVVRQWMMSNASKTEIGRQAQAKVYLKRWKEKWDLEEAVYRPAIHAMDILLSVICRILDRLGDYLIIGLRKTIYRDSRIPHELEEGNFLTHTLGVALDEGKEALNHTVLKEKPVRISFEHKLALLREELAENNTIIGRSLSFGLFMFCLGLVLTLIYMLWW